mgnify:CR=1 FL=1|jgi:hypothetical protein
MTSYNYNTISESPSSFQDKFLEYSKNWEDSDYIEKKRVKIIKEETSDLEKVVNSFIVAHQSKIKIYDIKFISGSVMIVYEEISSN